MNTETGTLVKIKDLIGRPDVDGLLVDLRPRVNGELKYPDTAYHPGHAQPVIARLKKVCWKKQRGMTFMHWEWEVDYKHPREWYCGFSGTACKDDIEEYQLLVVDPNFYPAVGKKGKV